MLKSLKIENFVLIESCDLNFNNGFTSITGETGSGKSILLNAISLLLGERADFSVIGTKSSKAFVEAEFQIGSYQLEKLFSENELDYSDSTIIRREISDQGRSRAFVNDTPVQLNVLRDISERLITIHSQYNTLELKDPEYQLNLLDLLVSAEDIRMDYLKAYESWNENKKKLQKLVNGIESLQKEQDYIAFQLNELQILQLDKNNFDEIEQEVRKAENAQTIIEVVSNTSDLLGGEEQIIDRLNKASFSLKKIENLDPELVQFSSRLESIKLEADDLSESLGSYLENVELNPQKLHESIEKLDRYNTLLRKHNLSSQTELIQFQADLEGKIELIESAEGDVNKLALEVDKSFIEMKQLSAKLHQMRLTGAYTIEERLKETLLALKLPETNLKFELSESEIYNATGNSTLRMLFSANKGVTPVPVEKAASGGELSRLMLALQKLVSEKKSMPTIFFDEIDTGVSGDVAQKIGSLLKSMGKNFQLFAITHLPQVAAKAETQLSVIKQHLIDRTVTTINLLSTEDRVTEIARLMSGDEINDAARTHAKELMAHE